MATTAIDTGRYARKLKYAGVPPNQAEAMADAIGLELVDQLATKSDFAMLKSDIAALESRLESKLQSEVSRLESKIDRNKLASDGQFRLLNWMVGFTLVFVVAILWRMFT